MKPRPTHLKLALGAGLLGAALYIAWRGSARDELAAEPDPDLAELDRLYRRFALDRYSRWDDEEGNDELRCEVLVPLHEEIVGVSKRIAERRPEVRSSLQAAAVQAWIATLSEGRDL